MKYLKYTLYTALLAMVVIACEVNSSKFPVDTGALQEAENTGGFLRILNFEGGTFNIFDLENQEFTMTLEADDSQNGGQLESVEFFVGFQDNSAQNVGNIPVSSDPILTVQASEFTESQDSGLPVTTVSFTADTLLNNLGIERSQVGINSSILLRWTLNLDNGQSFNDQNTGGNIRGGAFYRSPFAQNIAQSIAIPEDAFVGTYTFEQNGLITGGAIGGFGGDGFLFGPDGTGTVEIIVDPDNTLNGREFTTDEGGYLDGIGFGTAIDPIKFAFTINPVNQQNFTTVTNQAGTGLSCGGPPLALGAPGDVALEGTYDIADDSQFTLTITDNVLSACGVGPFPVSFTFTKQ